MRDDAIARQRLCRPIRHLHLPDTSEDLELKRIYLLGRFQGSGVGKYLVRTAVSHATALGAKRLLLGVYRHNHPAIAFYERVGFRKAGTRKFNVGGQDYDDDIMAMPLDG